MLSALTSRGEAVRVSAGCYRLATNAARRQPAPGPTEEHIVMQRVGTLEDTSAVLLRDGDGALWMAERLTAG